MNENEKKSTVFDPELVEAINSGKYQEYLYAQELESERLMMLQKQEEEKKTERIQLLKGRVLLLASVICMTIALTSFVYSYGIENITKTQVQIAFGICFLIASIALLVSAVFKNSISFFDVDNLRVKKVSSPADAWPFPTGSRPDIDSEELEDYLEEERRISEEFKYKKNRKPLSSFEKYFKEIKLVLEDKANDADKKASLLLDKGTSYTKWGIYFFIFSIVSWQVVSWFHGFRSEYIYGIVSCSALFIFIEFISAWYLKQYRHYVDTSTYLLKVKAIFDRYMLVYLGNESFSSSLSEDQQRRADMLLDFLSQDIKWPESYLLKKQDIGFAKEALQAIASLTHELRRKEKVDFSKEGRK
ncbi:hypothetical protein ACIPF8_10830 [Collimonas sp. NPDC087041]|uniref:hypothetical protein n=1 Tax=Collimonas sp. NPDC087041 TaxID=3363960 RepID=UPI00380BBAD6